MQEASNYRKLMRVPVGGDVDGEQFPGHICGLQLGEMGEKTAAEPVRAAERREPRGPVEGITRRQKNRTGQLVA